MLLYMGLNMEVTKNLRIYQNKLKDIDNMKESEYMKGYLDAVNDIILQCKNYQVMIEKIKNMENKK